CKTLAPSLVDAPVSLLGLLAGSSDHISSCIRLDRFSVTAERSIDLCDLSVRIPGRNLPTQHGGGVVALSWARYCRRAGDCRRGPFSLEKTPGQRGANAAKLRDGFLPCHPVVRDFSNR